MWKSLARSALGRIARALPASVQRELLQALAAAGAAGRDYDLVQALGRRCGITDIRVRGDYGLIEGALADSAILATYVRTRRWAATYNRVIAGFFESAGAGTYIDVGANIGLTTIPIARDGAVQCKAFEPEPANFRYLTSNLRRNCPASNVEAFNLALYDRRGSIEFELADDNLGDHRIRLAAGDGRFGEAGRRVIRVPTERLDDMLDAERLPQPIAIKIDTQGAECRVLAGGRDVLDRAALVAAEFWPYGMARLGSDVETLIGLLTTRFASGAVMAGDVEERPTWQPIDRVAARLRACCQAAGERPYDYCDVIVRR